MSDPRGCGDHTESEEPYVTAESRNGASTRVTWSGRRFRCPGSLLVEELRGAGSPLGLRLQVYDRFLTLAPSLNEPR